MHHCVTFFSKLEWHSMQSSTLISVLIQVCVGQTKSKHLYRDKFNNKIESYHKQFKELLSKLLLENIFTMNGFLFINLIYNLWTNNSVDCILWASLSFIDSNWKKRYIALIAHTNIAKI